MATIDVKELLTDEKVREIFAILDTDGCGKITPQDIVKAMTKFGHQITKKELDGIMHEHDLDNCGGINFGEFKFIFFSKEDRANPELMRQVTEIANE